MKKYMFLLLAMLVLSMSAGVYAAQPPSAPNYNAFQGYGLTGISVSDLIGTPATMNMGVLGYKLSMSASPTLYDGVNVYAITEIFGFWAIGHNFTGLDTTTDESWDWGTKYTGADGAVAGWDNPSKSNVIVPGGAAKTFTFTSLASNTGKTADGTFGFHVSVDLAGKGCPVGFGSGNTAFVFNDPSMQPKAVPEASTLVGFGSSLAMAGPGLVGWLKRRRS